ncbi:MAG: hypothetical protein AAGC70_18940 [Pseudomonadota bacterium]
MLFRRVRKHVKAHDWFAVGVDFVIVVIGVYIGIQVSNWNDAARTLSLEDSYVSRVGDEIEQNIEIMQAEIEFAEQSSRTLRDFIAVMEDPTSSDSDVVESANAYLSRGVFFAKFRPVQTTFDELTATGNLDIIQDSVLRLALIDLHAFYDNGASTVASNNDWISQLEGNIYLGFDAARYDSRTSTLFEPRTLAESAAYIRENKDVLIRHAALSYWVKDRTLGLLESAIAQSNAVLDEVSRVQSDNR